MLRTALLSTALALAPLVATAQDSAGAIEDVITGQLDAFNARDVATAWSFASPAIKRLFGDPGNFARMVATGYPMVWTNSGARFLEPEPDAGRVLQRVLVTDADGATHMLLYFMIETPEGWQIDGVSILPAPDLGV